MKKVLINSLGCPKNLVDSEVITSIMKQQGYEVTVNGEEADLAIVNTCAFIEPAVDEAISVILDTAKLKEEGKLQKLVVTGCMVERYREEILDDMPEVDLCVGIDGIKNIADIVEEKDKTVVLGDKDQIDYLNITRELSSNIKTAYVKIAEGCDNKCTYCAIPSIRGAMRSRKIEDIYKEVEGLAQIGIKEIILVAQDTTAYGLDIYERLALAELINEVSNVEGIKWIRMLYCYPELITDELINTIKNNDKVLKYMDIPLQHASDKILKLMGRKGTYNDYIEIINKLRKEIDDVVIRTTFITGFPGENEEDFKILEKFIKEVEFDWLGVFDYFREEGTPAYNLPDQIEKELKVARKEKILALQQEVVTKKNNEKLNKYYDIIVEGVADDGIFYMGRSYAQAPEIDGITYVLSSEPLNNGDIVKVKIINVDGYDLIGEAVQ